MASGNVINNNFNIINNFMGCPEPQAAHTQDYSNLNSHRGFSAQPQPKQNNWVNTDDQLNEKII
jgi:hypothetical protein